MPWYHKTSLEWMKKRQQHLTASDIKSLIPFTKTGRPRKITDDDYLKVLAKKLTILTDDDCISTGAMARGHLLEPYAVQAYNKWAVEQLKPKLYHWDDKILTMDIHLYHHEYDLAFSPDALDKPMEDLYTFPTVVGEVKCYAAERHLTTAFMDKMLLEERWQIATAMVVRPTIEWGYLILYNPNMIHNDDKLYIFEFNRKELQDEIDTIKTVRSNWLDYIESEIETTDAFRAKGITDDEEYIQLVLNEKNKLNP